MRPKDLRGSADRQRQRNKVEDAAWIGPNGAVTGGLLISCDSRIAARTVVTSDVEPHTILGANPMRALREDAESDVSDLNAPLD
jgi:acetyltransferase-like isoleucine patch superfamily enzyme